MAYISPGDGKEFAEWLAGQIPGASMKVAYAPFKRLHGYVVTDIQVNVIMDLSLSHGLEDLWNSPARNNLLLCSAGIIALSAMGYRKQISHILTFNRAKD